MTNHTEQLAKNPTQSFCSGLPSCLHWHFVWYLIVDLQLRLVQLRLAWWRLLQWHRDEVVAAAVAAGRVAVHAGSVVEVEAAVESAGAAAPHAVVPPFELQLLSAVVP